MRVLLAGATGAIGRPLIRGLKQHGHSVFGLVRSAKSTRMPTEMGAEAVIGDALDAASVRAAIVRVRPDAVINELTSLPRHYTPAEMKAGAERDSRVRREGNVNLLAGMRESGVRRYVLQSSGFWYAPGPGLADESSPLAVDASPGVAASARTYVELESTAFRASEIDCVAMRYGFFYGPGTWYANAGDMGEQVRRQQVPIIGAGQGVSSFVHIEDAASSASPIKALASISASMRVDSAERTKPNTLCPCCFRPRINGRPIAPVAPASRTLISSLPRINPQSYEIYYLMGSASCLQPPAA